ncbi:MAG: efflux RND transporter periplasmic adaptor subunit [Thermoguttaceae bacterium]
MAQDDLPPSGPAPQPDQHDAPKAGSPAGIPQPPAEAKPALRRWRKRLLRAVVAVGLIVGLGAGGWFVLPWVTAALNTVSTDDAYVNGHVTFVAPRVPGQVSEVRVDDNYRVNKGDLLVELDPEPYRVQVAIKKAAVEAAEVDLVAAQAHVRGQVAQARANRFKLEHAIEDVDNQIANLRAAVATLNSRKAVLELARANLRRGEELAPTSAISREEIDLRRESSKVAEASVEQALQTVYASRASLGLPPKPPEGQSLDQVPPDLDQNFSAVRQALGELLQSAAQFGYLPTSWTATPKQAVEAFYKQDPEGNLNRIYARLIPQAPAIKQAEAKLLEARRDLDQAELNRRYCDIVSEIDGVVSRRNVNPGNNVQVGQSLMTVRSVTEIWIDANFKETQLANLRIGQRVHCEVDMYGGRREFEGRITGFTMGTGQTLALLPPQNATGNFVKIVQRLPVRIELTDYNPQTETLFVGLSVTPYVYYKEPPTGAYAGDYLQSPASLAQRPTTGSLR